MLLAIDTSGPLCSAAILDGTKVLAVQSDDIGKGHAEHLMPMLEALISATGVEWKQFDHIASTTGPGSFTGLRVGLATARGLALGLNCPCTGLTVFEAFRFGDSEPLAVTLDAKRDQIWMQVFGVGDTAPLAVKRDAAEAAIPETVTRLSGSAAGLLAQANSRFGVVSDEASPSIEKVALVAREKILSGDDQSRPKPLYLRQPDAKPQQPSMIAQ